MTEIVEQHWTDIDPENGTVSHNSFAGPANAHDYSNSIPLPIPIVPSWEFVDEQGRHHWAMPKDGRRFKVKINDMFLYEKALRDGSFYMELGRGHDMTDQRKTTG